MHLDMSAFSVGLKKDFFSSIPSISYILVCFFPFFLVAGTYTPLRRTHRPSLPRISSPFASLSDEALPGYTFTNDLFKRPSVPCGLPFEMQKEGALRYWLQLSSLAMQCSSGELGRNCQINS